MAALCAFSISKASAAQYDYDATTGLVTHVNGVEVGEDHKVNSSRKRARMTVMNKKQNTEFNIVPLVTAHQSLLLPLFQNEAAMQYYEVEHVRPDAKAYVERRCDAWIKRWNEGINVSMWIVFQKESNNFIGAVGGYCDTQTKDLEIAYLFHPDYWGQGYAGPSVQAMMNFSESFFPAERFNQFCAPVNPKNAPSITLIEKLGFKIDGDAYTTPDGRLRQQYVKKRLFNVNQK